MFWVGVCLGPGHLYQGMLTCHDGGMKNIVLRWAGETPTDSLGRLAAFTEDETIIGEATYKRMERDPELTYLSGFTVDETYRHQGIATDMMHTVFDHLGRERHYVVTIHGNLGRAFMEAIAAEEGAPKIFELLEDHSYTPMN